MTYKRTVTVTMTCDCCQTTETVEKTEASAPTKGQWRTLESADAYMLRTLVTERGDFEGFQEGDVHFCSARCAAQWIQKGIDSEFGVGVAPKRWRGEYASTHDAA